MKLKFHIKLSYGIGGIADNAMYTLTGTFLMFFLTTVAGVPPAVAGTIAAMGSVWEAICGPICGFLSDSIETRFGHRKPFLLAAAFPVAIITSLLFTTIGAGIEFKIIYYGGMTLLFWTAFATFFVPYMAWGSDLTDDYNERTVLRSYAYVFNQVGMAIGMVMPAVLVDALISAGKSTETAWSCVGAFVGVCSGAGLLICALTIKNDDIKGFKRNPNREKLVSAKRIAYMFKEYFQILKLKPIRFIIGASLLYLIANTVFSSDRIYYFTYNMGMSAKSISVTMLLITVVGVALVPVVAALAGKTDKKLVFMIGIFGTGVLLIAFRLIGVESFLGACVVCCIYSLGNTCYWQLMPSMLYDVCEVEELASGEKHSGQVISLQALAESVSMAIGMQMLGLILEGAGFDESVTSQSDQALYWVSNCFTLLPGIFMILVALCIWKYPVNGKNFPLIIDGVEKRRRGESVDMSRYNDIF